MKRKYSRQLLIAIEQLGNALLAGYADEPAVAKFQDGGQAFRAWRSQIWDVGYQIIAEVLQGTREVPTDEELIAELPTFTVTYRS